MLITSDDVKNIPLVLALSYSKLNDTVFNVACATAAV